MDENIVHLPSSENASEVLLVQQLSYHIKQFESFLKSNKESRLQNNEKLDEITDTYIAHLRNCSNALLVIARRRNATNNKKFLMIAAEFNFTNALSEFLSLQEDTIEFAKKLRTKEKIDIGEVSTVHKLFDEFNIFFDKINTPARQLSFENTFKTAERVYKDIINYLQTIDSESLTNEQKQYYVRLQYISHDYKSDRTDAWSISERKDPKATADWLIQAKDALQTAKSLISKSPLTLI